MKKLISLFIFIIIILTPCSFSANIPITSSKNIIVIDRNTLSILYEKDAYSCVAMASTTKIMTCIIAIEKANLNDNVTISKKASSINGSTLGLREKQIITINDLLYGLMLRSGNDCAIAIAEHISGNVENFSILMNEKAKELGLKNTNFVSPHGLDDPKHYTSAYDLAILTDYALKNEMFKKIVSTKEYFILINNKSRKIRNTNELLGVVDGVYGVKTGFTFKAGRCLVSACKRNDFDIIIVVLGANTKLERTNDSKKLINYIFDSYEYIDIYNMLNSSFESSINKYVSLNQIVTIKTSSFPEFYLEPKSNYELPLKKEDITKLTFKINLQKIYSTYNKPNSVVGSICIFNQNNLIFENNILLKNKICAHNLFFYFNKCLSSFF